MMQPNLPIALGLPELLKSPTIGPALTLSCLEGFVEARALIAGIGAPRPKISRTIEFSVKWMFMPGPRTWRVIKRRHLIFLIFEARDEKIQLFARFRITDIGIRFWSKLSEPVDFQGATQLASAVPWEFFFNGGISCLRHYYCIANLY